MDASPTQLRWTVTSNGCTAFDLVNVTNNSIEAFVNTLVWSTCGEDITLDASNPAPDGTGIWTKVVGSSSGTITLPSMNNAVFSGVNIGETVQLRWTVTSNTGECTSEKLVSVTNNDFVFYAGSNIDHCADTAKMAADISVTMTAAITSAVRGMESSHFIFGYTPAG